MGENNVVGRFFGVPFLGSFLVASFWASLLLALAVGFLVASAAQVGAQDAMGANDSLTVEYSMTRGFITGPVTVEITASDPNATILVSTAWGTEWLYDDFVAVAEPYTGPIQVSGSTQVRAVAFTGAERSVVESHTFIDISRYSADEQARLRLYPVLEVPNLPNNNRFVDERTLLEVFWPDDRYEGVSAPAGLRNRQNSIRQHGDFRLYFRDEYGDGRLDYNFFPDVAVGAQPAASVDKINFHGGSQDGFGFFGLCPQNDRRFGTLMKDRFYQQLQVEMNGDGARGQYYLMFAKGNLVGIKNAEDVPHQGWHEDTFGGGEKDDFALLTLYSNDGSFDDWDAAQGGDFAAFAQAVDVPNYVDYHLIQWLSGNYDWPINNKLLAGLSDGGPFYNWAFDMHYTHPGCPTSRNKYVGDPPSADSDYQMAFADRVLLHFRPGGALTQDNLLLRWDDLADDLRPAVSLVYEEDLWDIAQGDHRAALDTVSDEFLSWLEANGYTSPVAPVSYSIDGGAVALGTSIVLSGGDEIWYTTDGTDPRAPGGAISNTARRYTNAVALPAGTVQVLARAKQGNSWSAAQPVMYQVGDGPGLVINEIHFNPSDGLDGGVEVDGDEYEFVELANRGSTAVSLDYFRLQGGVRLKFDYNRSPIIQPGGYVVLAENAERFQQRYGFAPDGEFLDKLSNSGDEVRLIDTHLNTVDSVTYDDGWAPRADGLGRSLSYSGTGDNGRPDAWRASASDGGTPGRANSLLQPQAAAQPGIILNEWNAVSGSSLLADGDTRLGSIPGNGGDWFELVVVNDHVDARGWRIVVSETGGSEVLLLSDDAMWSDLRSGTIITIAEGDVVAEDGAVYSQDTSYDPAGGDWWIHATGGNAGDGSLVTAVNFPVSSDNWQATIYNSAGVVQWGPVGEGIGALEGGVGNDEIGELEADPSPNLDPRTAPYDDGDESTFGLPNNFGLGSQDFSTLRAVFNSPPAVAPIADRSDTIGASTILRATAIDSEGNPFSWSAEGLPPGISINRFSGVMTGSFTVAGEFAVTVSATDAFGSGTTSFVWTVEANRPPVIASVSDQTSAIRDQVNLRLSASDPEGDAFSWSALGLPVGLTINQSTGVISGVVNTADTYDVEVRATDRFGSSTRAFRWSVTAPEATVTVTCANNGTGTVRVELRNSTGAFATYRVTIGNAPVQQRSISSGLTVAVSQSGLANGPLTVRVERNGQLVYSEGATVSCIGPAPTPTPTPTPVPGPGPGPEPTPVPTSTPTPTPTPSPTPGPGPGPEPGPTPGPPPPAPGDGIPGAQTPVEVSHVVSCLGGNGRIDTNIINTGQNAALYRIEFEGLSPRQRTVSAGDWWRQPITGRPDRGFRVLVKRDGFTVSDTTVSVICDVPSPNPGTPEIQVVNACRAGSGYILFQFVNNTRFRRSWVIEFEGVTNRSTSADPHASAVRAVTGRKNGDHSVAIRVGPSIVAEFEVSVNCSV